MVDTCTRCFRVSDEDRDNCPDLGVLGCPIPVDISDDKALVVKCDLCRKLKAIPIGNIMQRKRLTELGACQSDVCQARIILPTPAGRPATPPPITEKAVREQQAHDKATGVKRAGGK